MQHELQRRHALERLQLLCRARQDMLLVVLRVLVDSSSSCRHAVHAYTMAQGRTHAHTLSLEALSIEDQVQAWALAACVWAAAGEV